MPRVAKPEPERQTKEWVSVAAVAWALDYAPDVPAALLSTLVAVARYADVNGRGAYPSVKTVAKATRKSERQAKRDIADLRKLGLLLPGDPAVVAHFRPEQRPAVYDLPLHLGRPTPGSDADDPGVMDDTGVTDDTSGGDGTGEVSPMTPEGCHTGSDPVSPVTPKEASKNPKKNPSNSLPHPDRRHQMLAELDVPEGERDAVIKKIEEQHNVRSIGWWLTAHANGTLPAVVAEALTAIRSGDSRPPWCTKCSDGARREIYVHDMYGGDVKTRPCPTCNPAAHKPKAGRGKTAFVNYDDQSRYDKPLHRTDPWRPHLNYDDPRAFDGYRPHAVEHVDDNDAA